MSLLSLPQFKMPSSLGKTRFWKKRTVTISDLDPEYRVIYMGNVLTGWAKGDGCVDKPLGTLWRNHVNTDKPHIVMKVTITASGLKAVTKEHGLTEYWAHRITYCAADPNYPKVFCWIYRHEGRKMKQELRCHAVLCTSENKAKLMSEKLQERLHQALVDFRKEKISRQNARLNLANSIYDNPVMPNRKIMLHTGSSNYRPPNDRGKAASKLKVIEEALHEEDEEHELVVSLSDSEEQRLGKIVEGCEEEQYDEDNMSSSSRAVLWPLCRSASAPMSSADVSLASTETTSISSVETVLEVGGTHKEDFSQPSFEPMNKEDVKLAGAAGLRKDSAINKRLVASFDEFDEDFDEEEVTPHDREARIINYLPEVAQDDSVELGGSEADHEESAASVSSESTAFSSRSTSSSITGEGRFFKRRTRRPTDDDGEDNESIEEAAGPNLSEVSSRLRAIKLSEQDAISDESGYSEESNLTTKTMQSHEPRKLEIVSGKTTKVRLSDDDEDDDDEDDDDVSVIAQEELKSDRKSKDSGDLTVESAMQTMNKDESSFAQSCITEFCINI